MFLYTSPLLILSLSASVSKDFDTMVTDPDFKSKTALHRQNYRLLLLSSYWPIMGSPKTEPTILSFPSALSQSPSQVLREHAVLVLLPGYQCACKLFNGHLRMPESEPLYIPAVVDHHLDQSCLFYERNTGNKDFI